MGSGRGKAENKTNSAQLELGLGLSLAIECMFQDLRTEDIILSDILNPKYLRMKE